MLKIKWLNCDEAKILETETLANKLTAFILLSKSRCFVT